MRYRGFKVVVFYRQRSWVEKWFDDFKSDVGTDCIKLFRQNKYQILMRLKDGTTITAYNIENNRHGYRFDKAYIEPCITNEEIVTVIRPMAKDCILIEDY